jgi:hypothetical protein
MGKHFRSTDLAKYSYLQRLQLLQGIHEAAYYIACTQIR